MSGIEYKTVTAEFLGAVKKEPKEEGGKWRIVCSFKTDDPQRPLEVSAFDPHTKELLDTVKVGHTYVFEMELKPMASGQGHYRNFARKSRDGPFKISEEKPDYTDPSEGKAQPVQQQPVQAQAPQIPPQAVKPKTPQDLYWEAKGKREGDSEKWRQEIQHVEIRRESCLSTAAQVVAAAMQTGTLPESITASSAVMDYAAKFEEWVRTGKKPELPKK